ncbi:ABC transporter substrate-binding protein [Rhodococcus triatomae]|uniref:Iron complex transport system substrate-binding protein n=2 Tax=Rhodococcus triatomae TaxID=300028 RepID=A0A1G8AQ40_9NOCA|nr:ABC transporter substrate-binding protein [Rhodococcus triatomae]QNG25564.1 ABC transporter substrate-binding protein [Rhodococcus triatomae]SDH22994.1 iron complex transport system substrate-binding protein [Rhodococcus triatomae]
MLVGIVGVLALVSAGCSADEESTTESDRTTVVEHKFGSTTVEGIPERIVAGGSQWVDALLELGVEPIAYLSAGDQGDERGLYPWQEDLSEDAQELDRSTLTQIGAPLPEEEIAALQPDLILASFAVTSQTGFDRLNTIAPTVSELGDAQVDSWEDQLTVLGRILDKEDEAAKVIEERNAAIDDLAAEFPGLEGKTAVLSQYMFATNQLIVVADPDDGAAQTFRRLGMSVPPALVDEAGAVGGRLTLSPERVDALVADLVVMLPNGGTQEQLEALPGFADLPAVQGGGLAVVDYPTVVGFNTPSSRSVAYSLDQIMPQLEAVARA